MAPHTRKNNISSSLRSSHRNAACPPTRRAKSTSKPGKKTNSSQRSALNSSTSKVNPLKRLNSDRKIRERLKATSLRKAELSGAARSPTKATSSKRIDHKKTSEVVTRSRVKRSRSKTRFTHRKKRSVSAESARSQLVLNGRPLIMDINEQSLSLKTADCDEEVIHVEVCAKRASTVRASVLKSHMKSLLQNYNGQSEINFRKDPFLKENVKYVKMCGGNPKMCGVYQIHIYQLNDDGPLTEDWTEDDMATARHWMLPNAHPDFDGVWENLIFGSKVKQHLLNYAVTTLMYNSKKVDSNIISCNRVILLHGPPGTGKTSLCRSLAQQICIRMSNKYKSGQLVEINSHGLFSKWFSESGKMVVKMFEKIQKFVNNKDCLVCILIDEVESLTAARRHMMNGNEPSDSIRVVNALLTQLDHIRRYPNVLILTTSNVTGAIDLAFVDRADVKQYIGYPTSEAIYSIYKSAIQEQMRAGFIKDCPILDWRIIDMSKSKTSASAAYKNSQKLRVIANNSYGLSGRILKKIPILSHAVYLKAKRTADFTAFAEAMTRCVENEFIERENLGRDPEV